MGRIEPRVLRVPKYESEPGYVRVPRK